MITHILLVHLLMNSNTLSIAEFNPNSKLYNWQVVNDVVMGGRSESGFYLNQEGNAVFKGYVSLENNGGFSMVKNIFPSIEVNKFSKILLKIKGDGKRYQFRVKSNTNEAHSYISHFLTTGEWQIIEIPLSDLYPTFRGRKLSIPNYPAQLLEEVAILIGNKKSESFKLEIKWISMK